MRKLAVLVAVAAVSLVVSTGCGKSKITQCNALIDSANKSQAGFEHIDPDKPEKMKEAIGKIKKGNADVAATQVEDAKLKTLRDDYVKTHESIATTLQKREEIAEKLEKAGYTDCSVVEGGTMAWAEAGFPVNRGDISVMSLERQVRIAAGAIVLAGVLLARFVHGDFIWLSGFVGAGLIFAGVTDWCGMGLLIAKLPWNQRGIAKSCSR